MADQDKVQERGGATEAGVPETTGSSVGGGTAGTGGADVVPGSGPGPGAAGVGGGDNDTAGLTTRGDASGGNEARVDALGGGEDGRATGAGMTGAGSATGDA